MVGDEMEKIIYIESVVMMLLGCVLQIELNILEERKKQIYERKQKRTKKTS